MFFFLLFLCLRGLYKHTRNGHNKHPTQQSTQNVVPYGFELTTLRSEKRCSDRLKHYAVWTVICLVSIHGFMYHCLLSYATQQSQVLARMR